MPLLNYPINMMILSRYVDTSLDACAIRMPLAMLESIGLLILSLIFNKYNAKEDAKKNQNAQDGLNTQIAYIIQNGVIGC